MKGANYLASTMSKYFVRECSEAVNTLLLNDADSCIIVNEISTPVFQRQETGLRQITNNGFLISDFDKLYLDTRSLIKKI